MCVCVCVSSRFLTCLLSSLYYEYQSKLEKAKERKYKAWNMSYSASFAKS